jgi:hypothetical protein
MKTVVDLAHECGVDEIDFEHLIVYQRDLAKETAFGRDDQVMAAYRVAEGKAAGYGTSKVEATPPTFNLPTPGGSGWDPLCTLVPCERRDRV